MKSFIFSLTVLSLLTSATSSPNPLARGGAELAHGQVNLGYNSTVSSEVVLDDIFLIVFNLIKVGEQKFNVFVQGGSVNKTANVRPIQKQQAPQTNTNGPKVLGPQTTGFRGTNAQAPGSQAPRPQVQNAQAPGPQQSNAQAPGPQLSNIQVPGPQVPNAQAPEPQVPNTQGLGPQVLNTQGLGPQVPNTQGLGPQVPNTQAHRPQMSRPQTQGTDIFIDSSKVVASMPNVTRNSSESVVVGPIHTGNPSMIFGTCDSLQKEEKDLRDLEIALLQLLNATRQQIEMHRNSSIASSLQSCFSEHNVTQSNNSMADHIKTKNPVMNMTFTEELNISEPILSHQQQSVKNFTEVVTTIMDILQSMGHNVTMIKEGESPTGTTKGPATSNRMSVDTVCGTDLNTGPSSLVNYVMGRHRR